MNTIPTVCDCGHAPTPTGVGAGYATDRDGRTYCYPCADAKQAQEIADAKPGDRSTLYVSGDGERITTWNGGSVMRVIHTGARHPFSDRFNDRRYIRAVDAHGRTWTGTGANGMYASLRLTRF